MKRGKSMAGEIEGPVEWVSWGTFRVYGKEHSKTERGKVGVDGAVECPEEVKRSIREHGIARVELRRTPEACELYNALLRAGKRVALLAHGTC